MMTIIDDITVQNHVIIISKWSRFISLLFTLFSGKPFQTGYYYSKKAQKNIEHIIKSFEPDHIYCQLTRMSRYVEDSKIKKTLDYMDAFGVGMERRAQVTKGLQRILFNLEAKRMKRYESEVYYKFDHHTIISAQDKKYIGDGKLNITINPNGIDTVHFAPINLDKKYDIGFIGNMGYLPNIEAAEYLVKVLKLNDNYKLLLAGARPDKRVQQLENENILVTGWVDDIRTQYSRCKIFVAPLWNGTGQQNKIMEAMAMGIPCVTTPAVNNAIQAIDGDEILVANNKMEFLDKIELLLSNNNLYNKIKQNGIRLVKTKYSWQHNVDILQSIFEK